LLFIVSTILTAAHFSTAPSEFFWQQVVSGDRLRLMYDDRIGHTDIIWVSALTIALLARGLSRENASKRAGLLCLIALLECMLLLTRTRLALLLSVETAICIFGYVLRSAMARYALVGFPILAASLYFFPIFLPEFQEGLASAADVVQDQIPFLRIQSEQGNLFSSRDVLNRVLLSASLEEPIVGLGRQNPYMFGVENSGELAASQSTKAASVESPLRIPVQYGWPYFAAALAFFGAPFFYALRGQYRDNNLALCCTGICLLSIMSEGIIENYYGISGLLLFFTTIFSVMAGRRRSLFAHP
jgi:hypothetical protein